MSRILDNLNKNKGFMNWETTLEFAQKKFREEWHPREISLKANVKYDEAAQVFIVPFLAEEYRIKQSGEISHHADKEVPIANQILILHYLNSAEGLPLSHQWISFKELPSGQIYINPFYNRAIRPLIMQFGEDPEQLIAAGRALGGEKSKFGDASVTIPVFPMVPVTYVLWAGDDEFPPSGTILFDASAPHYLPIEDYVVIAGLVVSELKKREQELKKS